MRPESSRSPLLRQWHAPPAFQVASSDGIRPLPNLSSGAYHDLGMVFAKEWGELHERKDSLGLALQTNNLGQREFARVLKAAQVKRITVHGCGTRRRRRR